MKMSKAPRGQRQSVLLFGPPKSGKTLLAGKLAEKKNIWYVGMENGHATFEQLPIEWQERIELIVLPDNRSFPIAIETCLKIVRGSPFSVCEEHGKIDCALCKKEKKEFLRVAFNELGPDDVVIYDSLTQLTQSAIAHITKSQPDDYKMQTDDWGNLSKLMEIFCSHIQTAKYNVICISHESEVEMEDGKNKIVATAGSRNFSRNTAKYFGHVIYCEIGIGKHKFTSSTTAKPTVLTGSRTNILMEKMDVPTLESIFAGQQSSVSLPNSSGDSNVSSDTGGSNGVRSESNESTEVAASNDALSTGDTAGKTNGQIAAGSLQALLAARKSGK